MHICRKLYFFPPQDAFALVPVVKNMGGMLRGAELMTELLGSQSRSHWAAQEPGSEEIEDYENPLFSWTPLCPFLIGIKLNATIQLQKILGCSDFAGTFISSYLEVYLSLHGG